LHASNDKAIRNCVEVAKHPTWQTASINDIALKLEVNSLKGFFGFPVQIIHQALSN